MTTETHDNLSVATLRATSEGSPLPPRALAETALWATYLWNSWWLLPIVARVAVPLARAGDAARIHLLRASSDGPVGAAEHARTVHRQPLARSHLLRRRRAVPTPFLSHLCDNGLSGESVGGLIGGDGTHSILFDMDGTRAAVRQRAIPSGENFPPASRERRARTHGVRPRRAHPPRSPFGTSRRSAHPNTACVTSASSAAGTAPSRMVPVASRRMPVMMGWP